MVKGVAPLLYSQIRVYSSSYPSILVFNNNPMFMKKSYGGGARGGKGGGRFGGGGKPWERGSQGRDGGRPMMHSATCDDCGQRCEVPFKPNGKKAVFCSNCFNKGGDAEGTRSERPAYAGRAQGGGAGSDQYRDQLREINSKLDAIIRALEV